MSKAIPKSVRVGPYDISISHLDASDAEKNFGVFIPERMEIKLRQSFALPQQAADTMLHEILHAIWHISGMNAKDGEERLVGTMSTALCAFVQHNPDMVDWLRSNLTARASGGR